MNKKRTSYAFLLDMLWVCGFFAVAACIFVLAFAKADRLSQNAENLNHAVLAAENAIETAFAEYDEASAPSETHSGFDRYWKICEPADSEAAYFMKINSYAAEGLLHVSVEISDIRGKGMETIYTLSGARSLAAERRLP